MPSPYIDFTTYASRIAVADSQELKWLAQVAYASRGLDVPWYNLIGGMKSMKPIKEIADFKSIAGNEIVIHVDRPLGLPGVQGENRLRGSGYEETEVHSTYRAKVGLMAKASATGLISKTQTVIGKTFDVRMRKKTAEWFKWQMADEIVYELKKRAHARNTVFPNGRTSVADLNSLDYLDLGVVGRTSSVLAINQAGAFDTRITPSGQMVLSYLVMGPHYAFESLENDNGYQNLLGAARERGDKNELFGGGLAMHRGSKIHSYVLQDTTADGPIGGPGVPRARLGVAMTAASISSGVSWSLQGGGNARKAALTLPRYFQHFSNAAFTGHEGEKIAADTTTERYLAIHNVTTDGKIGIYAYKVNAGNTITLTKQLAAADSNDGTVGHFQTVGAVTYNTGAWTAAASGNFAGLTDAHPVGAMIYEVNAKGQPFVESWGIGENMMLAGYGSVEGPGVELHGQRIVDSDDYNRVKGIGYQQVWGCRANEDADAMPNGFVRIVSAYNPDGWPQITA
jgi:hypothetical protein